MSWSRSHSWVLVISPVRSCDTRPAITVELRTGPAASAMASTEHRDRAQREQATSRHHHKQTVRESHC